MDNYKEAVFRAVAYMNSIVVVVIACAKPRRSQVTEKNPEWGGEVNLKFHHY